MSNLAIDGGTPVRTEPFPGWPVWGDQEIDNVIAVLKSGKWGRIGATETERFERRYAEYHQARHGLCVNSGTTALHLALRAAGVGPGDEVVVPAYTFIATASAVLEAGAVPIFADIDRDTYNMSPADAERRITNKTRAIMVVHFGGRPADLTAFQRLCEERNLVLLEDAAQAWGSEWEGRKVGAIGQAGGFSFQSSKNINAGEGGILLTNDDQTAEFARSFSNCGRTKDGLWYEHHYVGGNVRLTEIQAAVLHAQLDRYEDHLKRRQENAAYLHEALSVIPGIDPIVPEERITSHSYHIYIFKYNKEAFRGRDKKWFADAAGAEGVPVSTGYFIPLYKQPVFQKRAFGPRGRPVDVGVDFTKISLPETERACNEEALWFKQSILLGSRKDMDDIIAAFRKVSEAAS